ncbi:MAG TPA: hypothetical protein VFH15_04395 [Pyrinomonadaceae bacterium]|nr:hypothetical protein [Pyrinomonadaceae bacterium]
MKLTALLTGLVILTGTIACAESGSPANNQTQTAAPATTIIPKTVTAADLQKLKWIEGTWRGTGEVQPPFFERYHFENGSTLVMEELADESLNRVTRTTRYELKDGQFGNGRAVATALDDTSVTFSPLIKDRNSFRWQSESKDLWKAILTLPATATAPAKETVYRMERLN